MIKLDIPTETGVESDATSDKWFGILFLKKKNFSCFV